MYCESNAALKAAIHMLVLSSGSRHALVTSMTNVVNIATIITTNGDIIDIKLELI